jgi:hypothetical protein
MIERGHKNTAPLTIESLEEKGLPDLVSQIILYSSFSPGFDTKLSREKGFWHIEHWVTRDNEPCILITREDINIGYEIIITEESENKQTRNITSIEFGEKTSRIDLGKIDVKTNELSEPESKLFWVRNPNAEQL